MKRTLFNVGYVALFVAYVAFLHVLYLGALVLTFLKRRVSP